MHLNNRARDLLDKYSAGMAQQFGARDTSRYFSLNDPQENALRLALLESVEFLNMITCLDVDQLSGQVISVGSSVLHTGRSENGRFIRQVGVDGNDYSLVETDSCAALRWDLLSVWANAGKDENEFYNLVQAFTTQVFALDMLRIGFNGKSRAKTTDPVANPNGEDVNIGWHERMKTLLGGNQIMTDPVVLDEAGDYKSLDAMASDLINAKIPAQFRNDPRLVVLVGADLVAAEQYRLYQAADRPTEKIAAQMLGSTIAGRQAIIPPFMPGNRPGVDRHNGLCIFFEEPNNPLRSARWFCRDVHRPCQQTQHAPAGCGHKHIGHPCPLSDQVFCGFRFQIRHTVDVDEFRTGHEIFDFVRGHTATFRINIQQVADLQFIAERLHLHFFATGFGIEKKIKWGKPTP